MKKWKRGVATVLAAALIASLMPVSAFAEDVTAEDVIAADVIEMSVASADAVAEDIEMSVASADAVAEDVTGEILLEAEPVVVTPEDLGVDLADTDTLLQGYLDEQLFGDLTLSVQAVLEEDDLNEALSEETQAICDALQEAIEKIASGEEESTQVIITSVNIAMDSFEDSSDVNACCTEIDTWVSTIIAPILSYLLAENPYNLYWFDKTSGIKYGCSYGYTTRNGLVESLYLKKLTVSFSVSSDYAGSSEYTVDTDKTKAASAVCSTIESIVEKYESYTDLEKITAYKEEICDLVSYNTSAASGTVSYGDPWQLIYVFDGNDDTNVVCEGYSKAFKYLCDLGLTYATCFTVTGTMNSGAHMWNTVRLCGHVYLVDVTNSDSGTVGQSGGLFMVEASDATSFTAGASYTFLVNNQSIIYAYDSTSTSLYSSKVLALTSASDTYSHKYRSVTTAATCTENGLTTYTCSSCADTYTEIIEAGHNYISEVTTEGTCTTNGLITYTCADCGNYYSEVIETTGHKEVIDEAVAATCEATGLTAGSHCSECGEVITAQTTVAATGHTEVTDEAKAATCTETGLTEGSHCSVCGEVITAQTTVAATGHSYTSEVTTEATCTEAGVRTYTCENCGDIYTEAIATTDHTAVTDEAKAATCTETGLTEGSHCSECGEIITAQTTIAAIGHNYSSVITTAATCTTAGVCTYTCANCADIYTEAIAATGHTTVADAAKAATCEATGLTAGSHCSVCNEIITAQEIVAATGHSYTSEITTEASCTTAGVRTYTCANCKDSYTETIAATGHTTVTDAAVEATCTTTGLTEGSHCSECGEIITAQTTIAAIGHNYSSVITTAATCTTAGVCTYTCANCGDIYTEAIAATGHSYTSEITTEASCTTAGVRTYTCANCGDSYTEAIAATGHTTVADAAVAATCTTTGLTEGSHCSECGKIITAQTTVEAIGHNYSSVITTAATCTTTGVCTYTCANCADIYTETIAATGHTYTSKVTKAATCTTAGVRTYTCTACGNSYTEAIAATGHTSKTVALKKATTSANGYTSGKSCSVCGTKISGQSTIYKIKSAKLSKTSYTYDGNAKKPTVTVTDSKGNTISSSYYTVTYSNNKKVGTATVTIKFKGNYSGTITKTFKIKPKTTTISSLTKASKAFTVKWTKKTTQVTGYQIQYSTSKSFSSKTTKTVTIKKNSTTSKKITGLTSKKKYYVRIRTYKTVNGTKYYSSWSSIKSVTTK